jgi:hypothetical protein
MANRIEDTIRTYAAAWSENDDARRAQLLEACWSANGTITLVGAGTVVGREKLHAVMGAYRRAHPEDRAVLTSAVDQHHDCFRFEATAVRPDGTTYGDATEAGQVDSEGKIVRILSFADPIPRQ